MSRPTTSAHWFQGADAGRRRSSPAVRPHVPPAQANEGADVAQFIGRVVVPGLAAVAARAEEVPVFFVGCLEHRRRQVLLLAAGRQCNGRRRGIEVAQFRRAGQVINAVERCCGIQRGIEVVPELVTRHRQAPLVIGLPERRRDMDRVLVAAHGPEVIPIGVHRLFRVALVADRGRHQTIKARRSGVRFAVDTLGLAQRLHIARGGVDARPGVGKRGLVLRVAMTVPPPGRSAARGCRSPAPDRRHARSTQHGTLPLSNWYGAYQRR